MNKSLSIIIALVLVVGIGGLVYYKKQQSIAPAPVETQPGTSAGSETTNPGGTPSPTSPAPAPSGITMAQVVTHNSRTSCWVVISGAVYDLTSWIPMHPGGEQAILQLCGTDGTAKFTAQHGGASRPKAVLAGFKIGILTQ